MAIGALPALAAGSEDEVIISTGLQPSEATACRCAASDGLMWAVYDTHKNVDQISHARRVPFDTRRAVQLLE